MLSILLDVMAALIIVVALILVATYWMETAPSSYGLTPTNKGLKFKFKLGVYRGEINLVRDETIVVPEAKEGIMGWTCYFPSHYSDDEMCRRVAYLAAANRGKGKSHSKDLLIFNEIINNKNTDLECVLGKICGKKK